MPGRGDPLQRRFSAPGRSDHMFELKNCQSDRRVGSHAGLPESARIPLRVPRTVALASVTALG